MQQSMFFYKQMSLLEYHVKVMFNNQSFLPEGFEITRVHGNVWMISSQNNKKFGKILLDFNKNIFNNIDSNFCIKKLINWFNEVLEDYYQMRFKQIFELIKNILKESEYYPIEFIPKKLSDTKYSLFIDIYDNYCVWINSKDKYGFKNISDRRLADFGGMIDHISVKDYSKGW